ncbi:MAG: carbohydrate ABC transporter permease [Armatimonadetes bacterium]|nr:carbohydrate ABC transporter permease [Armatimonadota bacterium]
MFADGIRRRRWDLPGGLLLGVLIVFLTWPHVEIEQPLKLLIFSSLIAGFAGLYWLLVPARDPSWRARKRLKQEGSHAAAHLVLLTGAIIFTLPFLWMIMTSLKPEDQLFSNPAALPHPFLWSNYPKSLEFLERALPTGSRYGAVFLFNTLYVSALSLVGVLLSCSLAAYAFARLRWPGRDVLFVLLLSTMMLPAAVTMIPVFMIYRQLGWVDTLRPLWLPSFFAVPFYVFLLRQFFMTIPRELEDAAKIDGCGYFATYWRIMLPQIKPALAAVAIMHFLGTWNDFMGPLIYISSPEKMTGSYALQLFQSAHGGEWALLMAAATLWTLPILALFFFTQRYFIQGVTLTGMKG